MWELKPGEAGKELNSLFKKDGGGIIKGQVGRNPEAENAGTKWAEGWEVLILKSIFLSLYIFELYINGIKLCIFFSDCNITFLTVIHVKTCDYHSFIFMAVYCSIM